MMKTLATAILLSTAPLSSQPPQAMPPGQVAPHFEFKGIKATDTIEQHRTELGKISAYANGGQGGDLRDDRVSGQLAFPAAIFGPEGLRTLRGTFSGSADRNAILAAFTAKWGRPSDVSAVQLQNGYGGTLISHIYKWVFAEGVMTLDEGGFDLPFSFAYRSNEQQRRLDEAEKPKVDF